MKTTASERADWRAFLRQMQDSLESAHARLRDGNTARMAEHLSAMSAAIQGMEHILDHGEFVEALERLGIRAEDDLMRAGLLAEAMRLGNADRRNRARLALTHLLPRLSPADLTLMRPEHRNHLAGCLKRADPERDHRFLCRLLNALKTVGGEKALPLLERLCESLEGVDDSPLTLDEQRELHQAATSCREAVRQRVERERQARTLLRPADAPADAAAVLLRPARGAPSGDEARLLRPVINEEDYCGEDEG